MTNTEEAVARIKRILCDSGCSSFKRTGTCLAGDGVTCMLDTQMTKLAYALIAAMSSRAEVLEEAAKVARCITHSPRRTPMAACSRCAGRGWYWRVPDGFNPFSAGAASTARAMFKAPCPKLECHKGKAPTDA